MHCYGNPVVNTPNIDHLAARGVRFHAAYCQYPLCNPSRSSMLNGIAPDTLKVYDNEARFRDTLPDTVTLPELFRKNGYHSMRVGKIFHAGVPGDIGRSGSDDPASWDTVYNPFGVDHTKEEKFVVNYSPQRGDNLGASLAFYESPSPDRLITDSLGADEAIRLMKTNTHRPFFLAYGLYRPHVPWVVPSAYFDKYPLDKIQVPPFRSGEMEMAPSAAYSTHPPNFGMTDLQIRKSIQAYYASTSFMDAQVGRVLSALKQSGLEQSTVVVFWGDHGWALGEHGQWQKNMLFEPVARIPMIIAGPDIAKGQVCYRTVEHLDLYPTLASLCDAEGTPAHLQGTSLQPLLNDPNAKWSRPAVTQLLRPLAKLPAVKGYSIRNERYRYTIWSGGEIGEELYDYQSDPTEQSNRAVDPTIQSTKAELRAQLETITAARGRTVSLG